MPLSKRDLDAIRGIVREEIRNARRETGADEWPVLPVDDEAPDDDLMRAEIRALFAWMDKKTPANKRRLLVARARYKIAHDESYQGYARRLFRLTPEEPITLEQMIETIQRRQPTMR